MTLMTSLLIRMGSKVIKRGMWTNQQTESRADLSVSLTSVLGHKGRALPGIPGHLCHGDPLSLLLPLQEMVLSDLGSSRAS